MELKVINSDKNMIEVELGNLTIAEILRVYLNKDSSVSFVAWRRRHPSENPILKVETSGKTAKKAINDAIESLSKDLDRVSGDFSKLK